MYFTLVPFQYINLDILGSGYNKHFEGLWWEDVGSFTGFTNQQEKKVATLFQQLQV